MIIVIVGPTGVGKTKLSEELSIKLNMPIINADAMQIYKELNIGTAKIKDEEMCKNKHYLFDIVTPKDEYSVYDYQKDSRAILKDNPNAIFVGGTGLYIKASLYNYEFTIKENKETYDDKTNQELYDMLKKQNKLDGVHINNRNRMISKLNSTDNNGLKDEPLYDNIIFIGLTTSRDNLYNRINNRVDEMIKEGLIDEVKALYGKYGKTKVLNTAIGYKEIIDYLDNNISLDDAIELIKKRSRHYAKRQYTWFNNQVNVKWFNTDYENFDNTVNEVMDYIKSK